MFPLYLAVFYARNAFTIDKSYFFCLPWKLPWMRARNGQEGRETGRHGVSGRRPRARAAGRQQRQPWPFAGVGRRAGGGGARAVASSRRADTLHSALQAAAAPPHHPATFSNVPDNDAPSRPRCRSPQGRSQRVFTLPLDRPTSTATLPLARRRRRPEIAT